MSQYYDPSHGNNSHDGLDGNLDPANAFQGNSSPATLSGIEIAIIIGTVVAFFSIVGAVFFYRQREARLKALAAQAEQQQAPPADPEAVKNAEDVSAIEDRSRYLAPKTQATSSARSWTRFFPGGKKNNEAKHENDERSHEMTRFD